jgi:ubiquinone/menaquinone biosynthesis C-methylase UbiE
MLRAIVNGGAALLIAGPASAQQSLSLAERAELSQIQALLKVGRGSVVADVGAGSGVWTIGLAQVVGPDGRVFTTEVRPELVAGLRVLVGHGGLRNVRVVQGSQEEIGLAARCCDAALLRLVYHAFQKPEPMRAGLARAMRPAGRVLVVDHEPKAADLIAPMQRSGFVHVKTVDNWNGQRGLYAALFTRAR